MKYTAWGREDREFTLVPGTAHPPCDAPGMRLLETFDADSWEDAVRQYHEWQGWEPYRPLPDSAG